MALDVRFIAPVDRLKRGEEDVVIPHTQYTRSRAIKVENASEIPDHLRLPSRISSHARMSCCLGRWPIIDRKEHCQSHTKIQCMIRIKTALKSGEYLLSMAVLLLQRVTT